MPISSRRCTRASSVCASSPAGNVPSPRMSSSPSMRGGRLRLRSAATSCSGHRCWWMSKEAIGELEPQSGAVGDCDEPVRTYADGLRKHEVAAFGRPAGWVVRKLEVGAAADTGGEVEVGEKADAVRPRVRREEVPACGHALGELTLAQEAHREHGVGLVDVESIGRLERLELPRGSRHLAAGDTN